MDSWSLRNLRQDLSKFLELVSEYQIGDFNSLYNFQGKIDSLNSFEYEIKDIVFNLNKRISGTMPETLNKYKISLDNTISLNQKDFTINDILAKDYLFELNIDSYASTVEADGKPYKNCWHLDKHIDSTEPKYTHPTYHFHFGGEYLEGLDTGEISIFSSPRLPHPPMDIFLGFHFIISNFYSSKDFPFVNELKGKYEYQQIIRRAQERLWSPYFKAFDPKNTHQDFTMSNLFPLYIS
ncbi:hypothetical protein EC396_14440 [Lutibacter sp. HS1-25]|uniref:hypothetical protein n=1 Tax=Lutibacter sp. HS1-25 TaxID=2485000 RepID=UPI0010102CEF|nr:hypothetical protein [Lutibacter sp. HS1-25]RXP46205.1 hypothetical protein EC396_14440 [Lutibacter sp. HS1-25]